MKRDLKKLKATKWGSKAIRISIAIGSETDMDVLQDFIGDSFRGELKPLKAKNASELKNYIRWASTAASTASINPMKGMLPLPPAVEPEVDVEALDW